MREIDRHDIVSMINAAYTEFNPVTPQQQEVHDLVIKFSNYTEENYGLKLNMLPIKDNQGREGYQLTRVFVIDEPKFTWFLLKWSNNGS